MKLAQVTFILGGGGAIMNFLMPYMGVVLCCARGISLLLTGKCMWQCSG